MKPEYYCLKELIKGNWETNKIQLLREQTPISQELIWKYHCPSAPNLPSRLRHCWFLVSRSFLLLHSETLHTKLTNGSFHKLKVVNSIQAATDVSVLSSWDGMSRRSRKRFSGTGGISSGRTTGFSLFPLCSLSPSGRSFFSGLWALLGHHRPMISEHKNWFLFQLRP